MQYVKEKIIDDLGYDKSDEKHDDDIAFGSLQKYAGDDGRYVVVIGKSVISRHETANEAIQHAKHYENKFSNVKVVDEATQRTIYASAEKENSYHQKDYRREEFDDLKDNKNDFKDPKLNDIHDFEGEFDDSLINHDDYDER